MFVIEMMDELIAGRIGRMMKNSGIGLE